MVFAFHLLDCFRKGRVRCVLKLYPEVFSPSVVHCSFAMNNVLDSISLYNIYGVNSPWGQHGGREQELLECWILFLLGLKQEYFENKALTNIYLKNNVRVWQHCLYPMDWVGVLGDNMDMGVLGKLLVSIS